MSLRAWSSLLALCLLFLSSTRASAQASDAPDKADEGPTLLSYGMKGLWTGAVVGLATGYISTGRVYEHGEWRKLVVGAGAGALLGVGTGIAAAIIDSGKPMPATGWFVLRDTGYGSLLGAFTGAAVGALFWAGGGRARDVLLGTSIGTVTGAGVGAVFGVIEGANRPTHHDADADKPTSPPPPASRPGNTAPSGTAPSSAGAPDDTPVVHLTLAVVPSMQGMPTVGPGVWGRF
jgi:hypothetical protein